MNKRDTILNLISGTEEPQYIPAAFFMHFRPDHIEGQPAIDRHLEFFKATGMDLFKIQYEQVLPPTITISKPEDWANVPPCPVDFFEPTLHIVRELVKAVKSEALIIMTLYSPFMWFKFLAEAYIVTAHFNEDPETMKKGLDIFTDYVLNLVRACKRAGVDGFYASTQGGEALHFNDINIFQEYIKPSDLAVWDDIKDDPISILHVCDYHGKYDDYSPFVDYPGQIVSCGLSVEDRSLSPKQISEQFQRPFMGGLERLGTIANGKPDEIHRLVSDLLADAPDRFILGADCTVPDNTPWENLKTAIDSTHQHRK
ncbi:MAG TPA: uroporphyrinogen decarboxylase family protein [Anaerolineales bacterium]|nr:uroporphyrinogen decarboxylase family protein [Anaerolineales bacterium]